MRQVISAIPQGREGKDHAIDRRQAQVRLAIEPPNCMGVGDLLRSLLS